MGRWAYVLSMITQKVSLKEEKASVKKKSVREAGITPLNREVED